LIAQNYLMFDYFIKHNNNYYNYNIKSINNFFIKKDNKIIVNIGYQDTYESKLIIAFDKKVTVVN